jgi:dethiobiotin synthetase
VAREGAPIPYDRIDEAFQTIAPLCDILFIEGAGGPLVPVDETTFIIDFASRYEAETILVAPGRLGAINDTLVHLEVLRNRGHRPKLAVNLRPEERAAFARLTRPYYEAVELPYILIPDEVGELLDMS